MPRTVHLRVTNPGPRDPGLVACFIPNVGIWSDHRRRKVNCPACLNPSKD